MGAGVAVAAFLLAACGGTVTNKPIGTVSTTFCPGGNVGGAALSPALGVKGDQRYIFRCDRPAVDYQQASRELANLLSSVHGLGVTGLKSTKATVALLLQEDDPSVPWGTHLVQAESTVFKKFAADKSMGDWLILVTDVVVHEVRDPIPPTAYRWTRQAVETYVKCGIPSSGSNDCKSAFFQAADQIVLAPQAGAPHGR
jgi:hypothetical protein